MVLSSECGNILVTILIERDPGGYDGSLAQARSPLSFEPSPWNITYPVDITVPRISPSYPSSRINANFRKLVHFIFGICASRTNTMVQMVGNPSDLPKDSSGSLDPSLEVPSSGYKA